MKKQLTVFLAVTLLVAGCSKNQESRESAQPLDLSTREAMRRGDAIRHDGNVDGEFFPVTGVITYDGKPLADARIRLQMVSGVASRVYACDSKADGSFDVMKWQTLYYCRLHQGRWKITGFTGYMPNPMP